MTNPLALAVLEKRSTRHKVAVPVDRKLVPTAMLDGLKICRERHLVVWLDQCHVEGFGMQVFDIYLLTPAGRRALGEEA